MKGKLFRTPTKIAVENLLTELRFKRYICNGQKWEKIIIDEYKMAAFVKNMEKI